MQKMMKYLPVAVMCAAFMGPIASCTAPIDIQIPTGEARPVIYCTLVDQVELQRVEVSRTTPYFSSESASLVDDATVTITTSEGDTYHAFWNSEGKAYYTSKGFAVKPGVTYTLSVEFDFDGDGTLDTYTATTSAKTPPTTFESLSIVPYGLPFGGVSGYMLSITGQDPPGRNFYVMRVEVNGSIKRNIANWLTVGDRMFQSSRLDNFPLGIFPGQNNNTKEGNYWLEPGDRVRILLSDVDKDFMRFVSEVKSSGGGANPMFGGPPYNIGTNISGGALGWFASLSSVPLAATVPGGE